ncbi:hypothetical protein B296_00018576 [Ensete ventricosum]|uniref:Uncharacterized protein n=1 Tax=Ensete ventricosum TaxID=4639 RepID=A0A427B3K8_ENSVE|nr:hypothetical protein B296_00018576 [Ensete ventricosum]
MYNGTPKFQGDGSDARPQLFLGKDPQEPLQFSSRAQLDVSDPETSNEEPNETRRRSHYLFRSEIVVVDGVAAAAAAAADDLEA